jgi:hypothetical protein
MTITNKKEEFHAQRMLDFITHIGQNSYPVDNINYIRNSLNKTGDLGAGVPLPTPEGRSPMPQQEAAQLHVSCDSYLKHNLTLLEII